MRGSKYEDFRAREISRETYEVRGIRSLVLIAFVICVFLAVLPAQVFAVKIDRTTIEKYGGKFSSLDWDEKKKLLNIRGLNRLTRG